MTNVLTFFGMYMISWNCSLLSLLSKHAKVSCTSEYWLNWTAEEVKAVGTFDSLSVKHNTKHSVKISQAAQKHLNKLSATLPTKLDLWIQIILNII